MSKINLSDNTATIVLKMSNGNPGAMNTIIELFQKGNEIDPDDPICGLGRVLFLDTLGIYGTDIYVLYNDICERDLAKMCAVLFAVQFGFFNGAVLKDACARQDYSGRELVPVDDLCLKVKERYPRIKVTNI